MAEVLSGAVNAGALNTHAFNEIAPALLYGAGAVVAVSAVPIAAVAKRAAFTAVVAGASAAPAAAVAKRGAVTSGLAAQATVPVASVSKRGAIGASIAAVLSVDAHQTLGLVGSGAIAAAAGALDAFMRKVAAMSGDHIGALLAVPAANMSKTVAGEAVGTIRGASSVAAHVALAHCLDGPVLAYSSAIARDVALVRPGAADGAPWTAYERPRKWVVGARPTTWTVKFRKRHARGASAPEPDRELIFVQAPLAPAKSSAFNVAPVLGAVIGG